MRHYETASRIGPGSETRQKVDEEAKKRVELIKQIDSALNSIK